MLEPLEFDKTSMLKNENTSNPNCSKSYTQRQSTNLVVQNKRKCVYCKQSHFKNLSLENRLQHTQNLKLCKNCLKTNHITNNCRSKIFKIRNKNHHTILHSMKANETINIEIELPFNSLSSCNHQDIPKIMLSTVIIHVFDKIDALHCVRTLLYSGSQTHFINRKTC